MCSYAFATHLLGGGGCIIFDISVRRSERAFGGERKRIRPAAAHFRSLIKCKFIHTFNSNLVTLTVLSRCF